MGVERALPGPEDIRALAAADLADKFAAVPGSADDLLERHSASLTSVMIAALVSLRRR